MRTTIHWIPTAFCAFISCIALLGAALAPDAGWWRPAFFAFLPMCFLYVGNITMQMHRELVALRGRLEKIEDKGAAGS